MKLSPTHLNYYLVCHRKLWLFAHAIRMEHTSDTVYEGKLIHETSYPQRAQKYTEIELDGMKIDHYDPKDKVVHEIKKSNKVKEAHYWQLKYYLWTLQQHGIEGVTGILEYPALRKRETATLEKEDAAKLQQMLAEIKKIIQSDECPELVKKSICRRCSYYDFCWSGE